MKIYQKIAVLILVIPWSTSHVIAQHKSITHEDSLELVVTKYYELNLKIFQANSTIEDINNAFDLFTDDFTYTHPQYGGVYTREELYNGYVRNQNNGSYDGSVVDIKILNQIVGLNAVVVQKCFVEKRDDILKEGNPEMTLFEFKDGKISRIYEYW
jgi:hypothetical protein